MSLALADSLLNQVSGGMVLVGGDFVPNQMPDAFLNIQFGVISRQVFDLDSGMCLEELFDSGPFVPGSFIDVEIDFCLFNSMAEVFEKC